MGASIVRIRITRNVSASGVSLGAGQVLTIGEGISEADAGKLVTMNKAVEVQVIQEPKEEAKKPEPAPPTSKRPEGRAKR